MASKFDTNQIFQEEDSRFEIFKTLKFEERFNQEEMLDYSEVELF